MLCKFTPLGFETFVASGLTGMNLKGVNLPRWGLKHFKFAVKNIIQKRVNLPRWGLKLFWLRNKS